MQCLQSMKVAVAKPLCSRPRTALRSSGRGAARTPSRTEVTCKRKGSTKEWLIETFNLTDPETLVDRNPNPTGPYRGDDDIRRDERRNLDVWSSPQFSIAGAIVATVFLVVYIFT